MAALEVTLSLLVAVAGAVVGMMASIGPPVGGVLLLPLTLSSGLVVAVIGVTFEFVLLPPTSSHLLALWS